MPMMGQFQNRTGRKLMPLPASRIYIPRQFDLLPAIGQSQTNTGVVDETVQAVQIFSPCRTAERGGPDFCLPPQQFLIFQKNAGRQFLCQLTVAAGLLQQLNVRPLLPQVVQGFQIDVQGLHQAPGARGPGRWYLPLPSPGRPRWKVIGPELPHPDFWQQMGETSGVVQMEVGQYQ